MLKNLRVKYFLIITSILLIITLMVNVYIYINYSNYTLVNVDSSLEIYEVDEDDNLSYYNELSDYISTVSTNFQSEVSQTTTISIVTGITLSIIFGLIATEVIYRTTNKDLKEEKSNYVSAQEIKEMVIMEQEQNKRLNNDLVKVNEYINHEFKNMLNQLNGYLYLDEVDRSIKYITEINETIEDIQILTSDNVSFTQIDLLTICAEVIDRYDFNITFNFSDDLFEINGNEVIIKRVIHNIIDNAIKYGAKNIDIELSSNELSYVLKISNDSELIDLKEIDNIFNYKYRIDNLKEDGRGIGLNLVKNVMDKHKGNVYVDVNEVNTFYLAFNK